MKHLSSWTFAACMAVCAASVTVLAYAISTTIDLTGTVYDDNGKDVTAKYEVLFDEGNVTINRAPVGEKLYFEIGNGTDFRVVEGMTVDAAALANSDNFSYTLERGENGDLLDYARLVTKRFDDGERKRYFEIALVVPQEDQKQAVTFDLSFKAKHTEDHYWQAGIRVHAFRILDRRCCPAVIVRGIPSACIKLQPGQYAGSFADCIGTPTLRARPRRLPLQPDRMT